MLSRWCDILLSHPLDVWTAYAYGREPLRGRISLPAYTRLHDEAAEYGRAQAEEARGRYGTSSPRELARALDVDVRDVTSQQGEGLVTFAVFNEPSTIEIYVDNQRATQALIDAAGISERLGGTPVYDMLLAHELAHVLQMNDPGSMLFDKHVESFGLGPLRMRSRLVSLEEVAAMSFAQSLLEMPVTPYVYDVFMLLPQAPDQARKLFEELERLHGEVVPDECDPVR